VEYCYFTNCDGDGELISGKATQNVYRFNTFENNTKAELVLRHGSEAIVYGNFFLNGKGGVRVREGQDHYIYNNYFFGLDDRAIFLQNEDSDPLDNINIAFNTMIDCSEVILGGDGNDPPTNVTFANNLFVDPEDEHFEDPTGNETWLGNIADNNLGMPLPTNGISLQDPQLVENPLGYFGIAAGSPAIDVAVSGFVDLPQFPGMDPIDTDLAFDIMRQQRPDAIGSKDVGCNEFPHNIQIQPLATEANTGPSYNTSVLTSTIETIGQLTKGLRIGPNPVKDRLTLYLDLNSAAHLDLSVLDFQGRVLKVFEQHDLSSGSQAIDLNLQDLPAGMYILRSAIRDQRHSEQQLDSIPFYLHQ
ncbi:MAG: chondroitinase-B domain-containing protein, partial [Bacteroidota bacterium]